MQLQSFLNVFSPLIFCIAVLGQEQKFQNAKFSVVLKEII